MYDDFASLYDLFVDWPNRLKNELPHLLRLGVGEPSTHIIDTACGTGHHARAWAGQGCRVTALDASAEMVRHAKQIDTDGKVTWRVGAFVDTPATGDADAVVCLGTSLPHVETKAVYVEALRSFRNALKSDGRLVVHSRNLHKTFVDRDRFLPPLVRSEPGGTILFWRFYDIIEPDALDFNLTIFRESTNWKHQVLTSRLSVVDGSELAAFAKEAGFTDIGLFGHLDGRAYDASTSPDLVLVAKR